MDDRKVMYFSTPGYDFPSHQYVAKGLAEINPEPQTLKEHIESDPERHEDYKRFCREKFGR